jgi:hypothetical protein
MKHLIIIFLFLSIVACHSLQNETIKEEDSDTDKVALEKINLEQTTTDSALLYIYTDSIFTQKVEIVFIENGIKFKISSNNIKNEETFHFEASAKRQLEQNGNTEIGEDEFGYAYFVDVYTFKSANGCRVEVHIAKNDGDKLTFFADNSCDINVTDKILFNSLGILRKINLSD